MEKKDVFKFKKQKSKIQRSSDIKISEIHDVKNKDKRIRLFRKFKRIKRRAKKSAENEKKKLIAEEGPDAVPIQVPRTIETSRQFDETAVNDAEDEELQAEEASDPLAQHFRKERKPKVLITCTERPEKKMKTFLRDLNLVIPNSSIRYRRKLSLQKFAEKASESQFTALIVLNEDIDGPNSMMVTHLPVGPTAFFRLSSIKTVRNLKESRKHISKLRPEILLNHFTTRLGRSVARILGSLFNPTPEFIGRRVCTLHNQRDFIFFRHHVYQFHNDKKVATRPIGPQFTLRLKWLRVGMMDGDYEWVEKKREQVQSKSKFNL